MFTTDAEFNRDSSVTYSNKILLSELKSTKTVKFSTLPTFLSYSIVILHWINILPAITICVESHANGLLSCVKSCTEHSNLPPVFQIFTTVDSFEQFIGYQMLLPIEALRHWKL